MLMLMLMLVLVLMLVCLLLLLLLLLYRLAVVFMWSRGDTMAVVELLHAVTKMLAEVGKRGCPMKTVTMDARVASQVDALWPLHRRQSRSRR